MLRVRELEWNDFGFFKYYKQTIAVVVEVVVFVLDTILSRIVWLSSKLFYNSNSTLRVSSTYPYPHSKILPKRFFLASSPGRM